MSEKASTWNKWAKAAQKLKKHLQGRGGGLNSVDKPEKTLQERRAAADKAAPAKLGKDGVYR